MRYLASKLQCRHPLNVNDFIEHNYYLNEFYSNSNFQTKAFQKRSQREKQIPVRL